MEQTGGHRLVIMDTNAFGGGVCAPQDLDAIRKLTSAGARVIVPDAVVRELAAHLSAELAKVNRAALSLVAGENATKLLNEWEEADHAFRQLTEELAATGAEISTTPDGWWQQAVIDQINSTPPAHRKGNVTTGAVDAVIARHALHGQRRYGAALVVTADSALRNHLEAAGVSVTSNVQEAVGLVADGATVDETRSLARAMLTNPQWAAALASFLPERFNQESKDSIDVLGLSNLSHTVLGLHATVVFAIDDVVVRADSDGEEGKYFAGTDILAIEAVIDPATQMPIRGLSLANVGQAIDYADLFQFSVAAADYVAIERACLPSPQAQATFAITGSADEGDPAGAVMIRSNLGDLVAARVKLRPVEFSMNDPIHGPYTIEGTDLQVNGPIVEVPARRPITVAGYLGARMFTLWVGNLSLAADGDEPKEPV